MSEIFILKSLYTSVQLSTINSVEISSDITVREDRIIRTLNGNINLTSDYTYNTNSDFIRPNFVRVITGH